MPGGILLAISIRLGSVRLLLFSVGCLVVHSVG